MERTPEVPASIRDEALFHCTEPSGVPRGPSQLHSIPDFSEAPLDLPDSLIAQLVKNPPAVQETLVSFLCWEDLLEKG